VRRVASPEPPLTIQGENWEFEQVAISPDGLLAATAKRGGGMQLWRTADGALSQSLESRPGAASLAWTADNRTVITAGAELLYWDIETKKPDRGPALPMPSLGLAVSPDGNLLATGGKSLRVLDRRGNRLIREIAAPCDVLPLPAFSPDGTLVAGNCRGVVSVWEIATGNERLRFGAYNLLDTAALSFSPDAQFIVASAGPARASLHRLDGSGTALQLAVRGGVSAIAFSPDMRRVALGTRSQMRVNTAAASGPSIAPVAGQRAVIAVYDLATGRRIFSLAAGDWTCALAFSEDGLMLLAATGEWRQPGKVLALEISSGRVLHTLVDQIDAENAAAFSPSRDWLAAAANSPRGSVKLWKLR
jgi:WD40 repeat protein